MNRVIIVISLFVIIVLKGIAAPKKEWMNSEKKTKITFLSYEPIPIIEIKINGKTINCIIDEDDDTLVLDREVAGKQNIKAKFNIKGDLSTGEKIKIGLTSTKELQIGDLVLKKVGTILLPLNDVLLDDKEFVEMQKQMGEKIEIHGIIGEGILDKYKVKSEVIDEIIVLKDKR